MALITINTINDFILSLNIEDTNTEIVVNKKVYTKNNDKACIKNFLKLIKATLLNRFFPKSLWLISTGPK